VIRDNCQFGRARGGARWQPWWSVAKVSKVKHNTSAIIIAAPVFDFQCDQIMCVYVVFWEKTDSEFFYRNKKMRHFCQFFNILNLYYSWPNIFVIRYTLYVDLNIVYVLLKHFVCFSKTFLVALSIFSFGKTEKEGAGCFRRRCCYCVQKNK
jgi:hypothetical protein